MYEEYYDKETQTLNLPHDFNSELKDLPDDIKKIIFIEEEIIKEGGLSYICFHYLI